MASAMPATYHISEILNRLSLNTLKICPDRKMAKFRFFSSLIYVAFITKNSVYKTVRSIHSLARFPRG